jgi:mannosyltransferase OCH1-like enzyme
MIPKILHYCWYGGEKPEDMKKYIEGWRRLLPEWRFVEWNESNTDLQSCAFVKEAYEKKGYAFVSDFARLDALFAQGGVYLDTDTELLKPLEAFLDCELFLGFENESFFCASTIGAMPGNQFLKALLEQYRGMPHFPQPPTTINVYLTDMFFLRYPLARKSSRQTYEGIELYPDDVFIGTRHTDDTAAIHRFRGSWL